MKMTTRIDFLLCAIRAALQAGADILQVYTDPASDLGIERKADNSPLTMADKKAHARIMSYLQHTPWPVLSEEGRHQSYEERRAWETLWVVDPLDGTKEFIKKNGEFTVNIALVEKGVPVLGVIYVPVKRDLYFADENLGAWKITGIDAGACDCTEVEQLLERAARLPLPQAGKDGFVVVASRSHLSPETSLYIEEKRKEYERVDVISSGSSIKICLVAEGTADAYPRFAPTMEWDTAAGHAIVRAAGREIYQAGTELPLLYNKENLLNPWFLVE